MKRYRSVVEVMSPVAISLRRATGNSLETRTYIPGTALRGALAQAYQEGAGKTSDPEFEALFLQRKVRVGDQRPFGERPWPCSARECADEKDGHSPVDLLLQKGAHQPMAPTCAFPGQGPDDKCGAKRRPLDGFYQATTRGFANVDLKRRRIAHTQIHPEFLRAMTGQFHTSTVLPEELRLEGFIWAEDEAAAYLEALVGEERVLYVGRGRSRGQGRVSVRLREETPEPAERSTKRIRDFNYEAHTIYPALGSKVLFSCSLLSGAILLNEWLMARSMVEPSDLRCDSAGYRPMAAFLRTETLAGWNAGAGFPRSEVEMVAPGSCFLFGHEMAGGERELEYARLAGTLAEVEAQGIGERREEGFGEVAFCEPIHWERAAR